MQTGFPGLFAKCPCGQRLRDQSAGKDSGVALQCNKFTMIYQLFHTSKQKQTMDTFNLLLTPNILKARKDSEIQSHWENIWLPKDQWPLLQTASTLWLLWASLCNLFLIFTNFGEGYQKKNFKLDEGGMERRAAAVPSCLLLRRCGKGEASETSGSASLFVPSPCTQLVLSSLPLRGSK